MNRYTEVWQDEWVAAQVLEGCAVAAEGAESVGRLVWHVLRLARATRPEPESLCFDPDKRTEVESRDLAENAINEPRGIAATAAMELANRLA